MLDSLGESADRYSGKRTFSEVFTIELRRRLQLEPSPRAFTFKILIKHRRLNTVAEMISGRRCKGPKGQVVWLA